MAITSKLLYVFFAKGNLKKPQITFLTLTFSNKYNIFFSARVIDFLDDLETAFVAHHDC